MKIVSETCLQNVFIALIRIHLQSFKKMKSKCNSFYNNIYGNRLYSHRSVLFCILSIRVFRLMSLKPDSRPLATSIGFVVVKNISYKV